MLPAVFTFYEFFAGGGMARLGLGAGWDCLFANDFDAEKSACYRRNFPPADEFVFGDVRQLTPAQLPGQADLAWASFPCQDLSLAGMRAGLDGDRCGTFWPFWKLMQRLQSEGRAPRAVVLENVCGALTSNGGRDFQAICAALAGAGESGPSDQPSPAFTRYVFGPMVIDARLFLPQSRPRLFIVAVHEDVFTANRCARLTAERPNANWHPGAVTAAVRALPETLRRRCVWWNLPAPPARTLELSDLIEPEPTGVLWHDDAATANLVAMMTEPNLRKLDAARASGQRMAGGVYKRTRLEEGSKRQRAEVRFDGLAGCLRTPRGGSSRQIAMIVEDGQVRSRLLSPRETARLMGLPEDYELPLRPNAAYHLAGDGVAVPVVDWLARHLLEAILTPSVQAPPARNRRSGVAVS